MLKILFTQGELTVDQAYGAMSLVMAASPVPEQLGAFLGYLRGKGESVDELTGFARCMRDHAVKPATLRHDLIDTCGTGGDGAGTFNISTAVALILAAAGLGVAKHGNRSVSSRCGSADVLEALGININLPMEAVGRQIDTIGFGFLFARKCHPSMMHVAPIRASLGVRTVFNILGPLTNPMAVTRQLIGVYDPKILVKLAQVLANLGTKEAMLVSSADGLDEISLAAETFVAHLKGGRIEELVITPEDAGLKRVPAADLTGGDARDNARIIEDILAGAKSPCRDVVLLNAAAALLVGGKVSCLREGVGLAADLVDSGHAAGILSKLKAFSHNSSLF